MKKLEFLLPVALLVLMACNSPEGEKKENKENHQQSEMKDVQKQSNRAHEETANKVQLDNGKKWKANPETIMGINNMITIVQNGIAGKTELAKLHDTLQIEFKTIFDKCTMTGESHNQLHNYLIPLKGQLEKLTTGSMEVEVLKEMQEYLLTFKNYFE